MCSVTNERNNQGSFPNFGKRTVGHPLQKKENLLIKDLKPSLNKNVSSEKLDLFLVCRLY